MLMPHVWAGNETEVKVRKLSSAFDINASEMAKLYNAAVSDLEAHREPR